MNRSTNDSIAQMVRKYETPVTRLKTTIHRVHYVSRRLTVGARGYGILKRVPVQQGIELGTPDAQIVVEGNTAWIERQPDGTWLCTAVRTKTRCATGSAADAVEVDTAVDSSIGYTTNDFSASIVPDSLFLPPFEPMGMITLPSLQFPDPTLYLCGIPQCTDCAPDGYTAGMTLILSSDVDHPAGCWVWGFRSAPCTVFFKSQGAIYNAVPDATYTSFGDISVAVREKWAYVAFRAQSPNPDPFLNPSLLRTYDLTDPSNPVLVDEQELTISDPGIFGNLNVSVMVDNLWVGGVVIDGTITQGNPKYIKRYDISTRDTPTLADEWATEMYPNCVPYLRYEGGVFVGQPYLVGARWNLSETFRRLVVEDGLVGGEIGVLDGGSNNFFTEGSSLDYCQAVICDNIALVAVISNKMWAVDLDDPTVPAMLWQDTGVFHPEAYIGSNRAYARAGFGSGAVTWYYSQINIDATRVSVTPFPSSSALRPWGYFLEQNCLHRTYTAGAGQPVDDSVAYNVATPSAPTFEDIASAPIAIEGGLGTFCAASGDRYGSVIYMAQVGIHETSPNVWDFYLSIFTSRDI